MKNQSDEELMKSYQVGDEAAFAEIYRRYSPKVYSYIFKKISSREEADEVFQKVFLKFHTTRKNYRPTYPVLQWLYVVARTSLIDHLRSSKKFKSLDELWPSNRQEESLENSDEEEGSLERLEQLPPMQRQMIQMRVIEDLSYEEMASMLNKSQESIRQTLSRALKKLRGDL